MGAESTRDLSPARIGNDWQDGWLITDQEHRSFTDHRGGDCDGQGASAYVVVSRR